jgi:hypothetical protein
VVALNVHRQPKTVSTFMRYYFNILMRQFVPTVVGGVGAT